MLRASLTVALLLALTGRLAAQDSPTGPAPHIMTAQPDKNGRPALIHTVARSVPGKRTIEVNVNGRVEKRIETVYVVVVNKEPFLRLDDASVRVYDVDGKQLDVKSIKLTRATPVLVSADGRPVDPYYTRLARPGTLVIVQSQADGAPVIAPPPPREIKRP